MQYGNAHPQGMLDHRNYGVPCPRCGAPTYDNSPSCPACGAALARLEGARREALARRQADYFALLGVDPDAVMEIPVRFLRVDGVGMSGNGTITLRAGDGLYEADQAVRRLLAKSAERMPGDWAIVIANWPGVRPAWGQGHEAYPGYACDIERTPLIVKFEKAKRPRTRLYGCPALAEDADPSPRRRVEITRYE